VITGNAALDAAPFRGWFIGGFIPDEFGLRATPAVEVKWGVHPQGESPPGWGASHGATSLSVLVRGCIHLFFEDGAEALLDEPGDYALWPPGLAHRWDIERDDTVVLTVRWPSPEAG
jgi:hypothetical protein